MRAGALACAALMAGCASPNLIITSAGPVNPYPAVKPGETAPTGQFILHDQFKSSFDNAKTKAADVAKEPTKSDAVDVQAAYTQMVKDGFALTYGNCSDFFQHEGERQKWIIFSRDVLAAVGTLATAVTAAAGAPNGVTTGRGGRLGWNTVSGSISGFSAG